MFGNYDGETTQLARGANVCKRLALLCRIALAIFALWSLVSIAVLCYWIAISDLPSDALLAAYAIPFVNILYAVNACLIPLIFGNMLGDISENRTPFTMKNSKRLKWLGYILVVYAILEELLAIVAANFSVDLISSSIQMNGFIRDHVPEEGTTLNLFPLLMGAVFFALSYVFKYGVLLQQESDETL